MTAIFNMPRTLTRSIERDNSLLHHKSLRTQGLSDVHRNAASRLLCNQVNIAGLKMWLSRKPAKWPAKIRSWGQKRHRTDSIKY
jgi:hypothetical protein